MMKKLFGSKKEEKKEEVQPKLDPKNKEQMKEVEKDYKKQLNKEMREIERGVIRNDYQAKKIEAELKKALKDTNDKAIHNIYAKQLLQCRTQKARLLNSKAKVQGLVFAIENMFMNMKMNQLMGDTSNILTQINGLMNIKDMQNTMKNISKSMMQFGLINEMVEDTMGQMDDDMDDMEDSDLDRVIDSVKNPEKYKNNNNTNQNEVIENPNDVNDLEAKLKALS